MDKKYKDVHGKAVKWKNTRYGVKYFRRQLALRLRVAGICSTAITQIQTIQAQPAKTRLNKINKAMAIAKVILESNVQNLKLIRGV